MARGRRKNCKNCSLLPRRSMGVRSLAEGSVEAECYGGFVSLFGYVQDGITSRRLCREATPPGEVFIEKTRN